jgi:8-oxo-dGTP diphosphatase
MADRHEIFVVAGVLARGEEVLIAQRPADKHGEGLWEFPGGKIEADESADAALARELHEELGIEVVASAHLISLTHDYDERRVHLEFLTVSEWHGEPVGREGQQVRWCARSALGRVDFLAANAPIISELQRQEGTSSKY